MRKSGGNGRSWRGHTDAYNTPVNEADPEVFRSKVEASGKQCRVMIYGEEIDL